MDRTVEHVEILHARGGAAASTPEGAVSWAAILAGALAAAALSLILLALGTGLGLSSISPWSYEGASSGTMGFAAIAWLSIMAAIASGLGGYLAGRLRARWLSADADETFFRDTAHGFLAWAVATVISAAVLTSAATAMVGAAAKTAAAAGAAVAGTAVAGGAAAADRMPEATGGYFVDMLFRGSKPAEPGTNANDLRREAGLILTRSLGSEMPAPERQYLAKMVADRTGISQADAEQRVTQVASAARLAADAAAAKAKEVADAARKATAYAALWVFVSLLVGAFCAATAATWGGRQRDGSSYRRNPV